MIKSVVILPILLALSTVTQKLQAQIVGGNLGVNYSSLRLMSESKEATLSGGSGYSLQLQIEDIYNPVSKLGLALQIDQYRGNFRVLDGSPMSAQRDEGTTERLQLGLAVLPFQLLFFEQLQLQLGAEVNFLLSHNTTGSYWNSGVGEGPNELTYGDPTSDFHHNTTYGLVGKIAYRLPISTNWLFVPQFRYHHGLSADMGKVAPISSSRSIFACGLMYKIK